MDKAFAEMFAKEPDAITGGDYFYRVPWLDDIFAEAAKRKGLSPDEFFEWRDGRKTLSFGFQWLRGNPNPFIYDSPVQGDCQLEETIGKIAIDNKPFMDIASSDSMGLAPYVLRINPQIPCLVTDVDANEMKTLRSCIDRHLRGYNINIASFDNNDIPMKDNSIEYITGNYAITSSGGNPADNPKMSLYQNSAGKEKAIGEVYRVLKPGGLFVAVERNKTCDFDLRRVYDYHSEHGSLFGLYSYDEIQAVLELFVEEPWRDKFVAAGFEVEVEKNQYECCSLYDVMEFLHWFTKHHEIRRWEKERWEEQRKTEGFVWDFDKSELENIGMDLYDVDSLYILRKPG